jgi:PAS domain S-box-containing protein
VRSPGATGRGGIRIAGRLLALFLSGSVCAAALDPPARPEVIPYLNELFWALLFVASLAVGGITWAGFVIRRNIGREAERLRQREATVEAYYQELFENAHDILFTHDLRGRLYSLNKAGENVLGYSRQEASGVNFIELLPPDQQAAYRGILEQLHGGTASRHCELEVQGRDGRRVALRVDVRLRLLPGKPAHVQGLAWDITERKRAEEALHESELRLRQSLEDRVRLGQDLHDGIIQSLYAIGLGLQESRKLLRERPVEVDPKLAAGVEDLNLVIRDVRNFIMGLEPEALKGREFTVALEALVAAMRETTGMQFCYDVDSRAAARLNVRQSAHLLQIAREALSNSVRHGRPRTATVSLQELEGNVRFEVQDDGAGFDPGAAGRPGFGLRNIEARARELNARCQIISAPGRGTRVAVDLPEPTVHGTS